MSAERTSIAIRAVDDAGIDDAIRILCQGFPNVSRQRWEDAFERFAALGQGSGRWPYGFLLVRDERVVGIILTLASNRFDEQGGRYTVVNLSSWFVDETSRLMAPRMLKHVLAFYDAVFTDLTPATEALSNLARRLGFSPWTTWRTLIFLPLAALARGAAPVTVRTLKPSDAFPAGIGEMLEVHRRVGCIAAVIEADGVRQPLLFAPFRRRGIRFLRLVYAEDRESFIRNIPVIARFLMRRGDFFLVVDATDSERPRGVVLRQKRPSWYRGRMSPSATDYAYSEYVSILR